MKKKNIFGLKLSQSSMPFYLKNNNNNKKIKNPWAELL